MATWTLADIRQKVRQVTGRFTENEMTTTQLDDYINKYYTLTFPAEVKLEQKHTYYEFQTIANQAYYDQPQTTYTNFEPPATVNNLQMLWYQDPVYFLQNNPLQYTFLTPYTGDGSTTSYTNGLISISNITQADPGEVTTSSDHGLSSGNVVWITDVSGMTQVNNRNFEITVTGTNTFTLGVDTTGFGAYSGGGNVSYPINLFNIMPGTFTFSDNVETFQDTNQDWSDDSVTITGDQGGTLTLNYYTGNFTGTFATAPNNGQIIHLNYVQFQPGRPQSILMYNNQFQLYPPPDQVYIIKMRAYSVVSELTSSIDTPELNEWGPMIAYGTSRDIFSDFGEIDAYGETTLLYKEQKNYVLTRTCQDLLNTRSTPNF